MHLPCLIGDYTDFYVGIHHATNVGKQFRPDNPLLPNYKYVPIGYHGRASSVRVSGEPVVRPKGQRKPPDADAPEYGPSRRLDYELELGIWIGRGNELGAADPDRRGGRPYRRLLPAQRLVGARPPGVGISAARAVPRQEFPDQRLALGGERRGAGAVPHSRCRRGPRAIPRRCPISTMRRTATAAALGIQLEVTLSTAKMRDAGPCAARPVARARPTRRCTGARRRSSPTTASNGCNLQPGDLIGTGTLVDRQRRRASARCWRSARAASSRSSLPSGETRSFLEDGDEITLARLVRGATARCGSASANASGGWSPAPKAGRGFRAISRVTP